MKKRLLSILFSAGFVLALASMGFASVAWDTINIGKVQVSVNYVDPYSGKRILHNYSGVVNHLEIDRDSNNNHYVFLSTANIDNTLEINMDAVGGGLSTMNKTEVNGSWRESLMTDSLGNTKPNIIHLADGVEMLQEDLRALTLSCTYITDSANSCNPTVKMTAAGMLTLWASTKVPAKVTVLANAKGIPATTSAYGSIGKNFIPEPPPSNYPPVAASFDANIIFGNASTIDMFRYGAGDVEDGQAVNVIIPTGPYNGVYDSSTKKYTPSPGFVGTDSFTYLLQDTGNLLSETALVKVTVGDRSAPAVGSHSFVSFKNNSSIDGSSFDFDPSVTGLNKNTTFSADQPKHGKLTYNTDTSSYNYLPDPGFDGVDFFTYTISDKNTWSITAPITFEVVPNAVDDVVLWVPGLPPSITRTTILANDKYTAWQDVKVEKVGANGDVSLDSDIIHYTPLNSAVGNQEYFAYTLTDTNGRLSRAFVTIKYVSPY